MRAHGRLSMPSSIKDFQHCLPIPLHSKQIVIKDYDAPRDVSGNSYLNDLCYSIAVIE